MKYLADSHVGKVRQINEDAYAVCQLENALLMVICDGVGGENAGEIASHLACDEIIKSFKLAYRPVMEVNSIKNLLISCVTRANIVVYETGQNDAALDRMSSTVVAAFCRGTTLQVVHAGDSRAYVTDDDTIHVVTNDHTVARMLFEQGKIDSKEMESIPEKNIITRAIGIHFDIDLEYSEEYLEGKGQVILCTDGLYRYLSDQEIFTLSKSDHSVDQMIQLANSRGGADNITAIVAEYEAGEING